MTSGGKIQIESFYEELFCILLKESQHCAYLHYIRGGRTVGGSNPQEQVVHESLGDTGKPRAQGELP